MTLFQVNTSKDYIEKVLKVEEQFSKTLALGIRILDESLLNLKNNIIPGGGKLYDTYGFPIDLTMDIARERNLIIDTLAFEQEMKKQRIEHAQIQV